MNRRSSKRRSSKRRSSKRAALQPNLLMESAPYGSGTREKPQIIERVDDVDAFLAAPGYYQTASSMPAYLVFKSLEWHPRFYPGRELFFPEGSIYFARVLDHDETPEALTPNIEKERWTETPDYFENIKRNYADWQTAWWREAIQNARDAGATRLICEVKEDVYTDPDTGQTTPAMRVSAEDNGSGMDKDVLFGAFFRRGGTFKPRAQAAGGFGDAKELLLLAHLGYEVRTRNLLARGVHDSVFKPIDEDQPILSGTRITVWMPLTHSTAIENAQKVVELSNLLIDVLANGKRIVGTLPAGTERLRLPIQGPRGIKVGEIIISYDPDASVTGIFVRSRGIYTWQDAAPRGVTGAVVVEVDAPPIFSYENYDGTKATGHVFDQKRTGFSWTTSAHGTYENFKNKLAADAESTLMSKRDRKRTIYLGAGSIEAESGEVGEMAAKVFSREWEISRRAEEARQKNAPFKLSKEEKERIEQREREEAEARQRANEERRRQREADDAQRQKDDPEKREKIEDAPEAPPLPSTFGKMMDTLEMVGGEEQLVAALQLSMWQPHFMLAQEISPWTPPPELLPATMSLDYWKIRQFWTDVCKFLLVQLGMGGPFGIGWVIDDTEDLEHRDKESGFVAGAHVRSRGVSWLMINPIQIAATGTAKDEKGAEHRVYRAGGPLYDLGNVTHLREIAAVALHEITHMQGFPAHNESFTSAEKKNMPALMIIGPHLEKIAKMSIATAQKQHAAMLRAAEGKKPRALKPKAPPAESWDVILGRVALALYDYGGASWSEEEVSAEGGYIANALVKQSGYKVAQAVDRLLKRSDVPLDLRLRPETIIALHDAAMTASLEADKAAGGGAQVGLTILSPDDARKIARLWVDPPADPRTKPPGAKKPKIEPPSGMHVFSWQREGGEWVLRQGLVGQRGEKIVGAPGDTSWAMIQSLRSDARTAHPLASWYAGAGGRPASESIYVWYPTDVKRWTLKLMRRLNAYNAASFPYDESNETAYVEAPGRLDAPVALGGQRTFPTVADAQRYVVEKIQAGR